MSDNFFDENIRKKLETIQPEYSDAAWKKLKRALPMPWYVTLLRDFGGWIFGGVASVALLTNYFYNQNIKEENQSLNDKISILENKKIDKTQENFDTVYFNRIDTIYLTKYVAKEIVKYVPIQSEEELIERLSKTNNKKTDDDNLFQNKENIGNYVQNVEEIKNKEEWVQAKDNNPLKNEAQIINSDNKNIIDHKPMETSSPDDEKITEKPKGVPLLDELFIPDSKTNENEPKNKKSSIFKNTNPRFGITADMMGDKMTSFGPNIEIVQGERFGFSTGLLLGGGVRMKYGLPRDFNQGTGKQFEQRYEKFFNEKPTRVEDIFIETSTIQLPINLNYYIPLNYRLGFMLSTGTKLNLKMVEKVSFTGRGQSGLPYLEKFERPFKPSLFNNLSYGMGLQYQKGRFVGQFFPYFEFPFSQGAYLNPPKRFGANATVKFSLKK